MKKFMKKSYNIKLGNNAFNIDEDALELLEKGIARRVANSENMGDGAAGPEAVEAVIAEELAQLVGNDGIVTLDIVRALLDDACEQDCHNTADATGGSGAGGNGQHDGNEQHDKEASGKVAGQETPDEAWRKAMLLGRKLFRNPFDSMLGGVLSGVALYYNLGVAAVRLLFVLLFLFLFFTGTHIAFVLLVFYIVMWVVIPKAKNVIDLTRLRKPNIPAYDTASADEAWKANYDVSMAQMAFPKNRGCMYSLVRVVFVLLLAMMALPFLILLLSTLGIFVLLAVVVLAAYGATVYNNIIFVLVVAIPLLALVHWILKKCGCIAPMNRYLKMTIVVVWLALCLFGCTKLYNKISADGGVETFLENNVDKNLFNESFWQNLIEKNIGRMVDEFACSYSAWVDNTGNLPFAIDAKRSPAFDKITVRFMNELLPEASDGDMSENYEYSSIELSVSDISMGSMFFIWNPMANEILVDIRNDDFISGYSMSVNSYDIPVRFVDENDAVSFDNAAKCGMVPFEISFKEGSLPQLYIYGSDNNEGVFVPSVKNYMYGSVVYDNMSAAPHDTTACPTPYAP